MENNRQTIKHKMLDESEESIWRALGVFVSYKYCGQKKTKEDAFGMCSVRTVLWIPGPFRWHRCLNALVGSLVRLHAQILVSLILELRRPNSLFSWWLDGWLVWIDLHTYHIYIYQVFIKCSRGRLFGCTTSKGKGSGAVRANSLQ